MDERGALISEKGGATVNGGAIEFPVAVDDVDEGARPRVERLLTREQLQTGTRVRHVLRGYGVIIEPAHHDERIYVAFDSGEMHRYLMSSIVKKIVVVNDPKTTPKGLRRWNHPGCCGHVCRIFCRRMMLMLKAIAAGVGMAIGFVTIGALGFKLTEADDCPWLDVWRIAIYSATTVGYGQTVPSTDASRIWFIVYMVVGFNAIVFYANYLVKSMSRDLYYERIHHVVVTHGNPESLDVYIFIVSFLKAFILTVVLLAIGISWLMTVERINLADSFYLCAEILTTVGYGDDDWPHGGVHDWAVKTQIFMLCYTLVGVWCYTGIIAVQAQAARDIHELIIVKKYLHNEMTVLEILDAQQHYGAHTPHFEAGSDAAHEFDRQADDQKLRYVCNVLVHTGKCRKVDVNILITVFHKMDHDDSGYLTRGELLARETHGPRSRTRRGSNHGESFQSVFRAVKAGDAGKQVHTAITKWRRRSGAETMMEDQMLEFDDAASADHSVRSGDSGWQGESDPTSVKQPLKQKQVKHHKHHRRRPQSSVPAFLKVIRLRVACFGLGFTICYIIALTMVMHFHDGWSVLEAWEFTAATVNTIGYGTIVPRTDSGRVFVAFALIIGLNVMSVIVGVIASEVMIIISEIEWGNEDDVPVMAQEPTRLAEAMSDKALVFKIVEAYTAIVIIWGFGTIWYVVVDDKNVLESLYFCAETFTTVGFGEHGFLEGCTIATRIMSSLFCFGSVASYGYALSVTSSVYTAKHSRSQLRKVLTKGFTIMDVNAMDANDSGTVSRFEFMAYMLTLMNKCHPHDICAVLTTYEKLEAHKAWKRLPHLKFFKKGHLNVGECLNQKHEYDLKSGSAEEGLGRTSSGHEILELRGVTDGAPSPTQKAKAKVIGRLLSLKDKGGPPPRVKRSGV